MFFVLRIRCTFVENYKRIIMKKLVLLVAVCLFSSFTSQPFITEGKNVTFRIENYDRSPVYISITDSENRVIFSETVENKLIISKRFNFEEAFSDTYTIEVKDEGVTYKKVLEI